MATTGIKLLCVGDMHLGRGPSRLPQELLDCLPAGRLGPGAAWKRSVDHALEEQVDGVLLAGDVVEDEKDFYEAYADLKQGVERLTDSGIPVLGVAGNHDVYVLPRLADSVPGFRFLGRGGRWEDEYLTGAEGGRVRVVGWSFPDRIVRSSPLAAGVPQAEAADGTREPTIGLLHCDCDRPGSRYAPVTSFELEGAHVDTWVLGHIHRPQVLSRPSRAAYLGSVTGLDPGETGPRGPWLLEVFPGRDPRLEHLPLGPLRWEEVQVSVEELEAAEDVDTQVVRALHELHERIGQGAAAPPEAVGCRLRLVGRTPFRREIARRLGGAGVGIRPQPFGDVWYFVHDIHVAALPAIDLEELAAGGGDPVSLLARKILVLRGGESTERRELVEEGRRRLAALRDRNPFSLLEDDDRPADPQVAETLEEAGLRALDELIAQQEGEG